MYRMVSRDIFEAIAAIMCPLPDLKHFADSNDHLDDNDLQYAFADAQDQALRERGRVLAELHERAEQAAEIDSYFDPLLGELAACRDRMLELERVSQLLIAYAREYVRPQPYKLKDLAQAAGMSISGVRIAYDEDEVRRVGELTGDKPRRPLSASAS
jgi:hypothetical protein